MSFCELFWLQMKAKCSYLGARLAVLRLRWSHLGPTSSTLGPIMVVQLRHCHLQKVVPSGPAAEQESTQQPPKTKKLVQNALPSGPAAQNSHARAKKKAPGWLSYGCVGAILGPTPIYNRHGVSSIFKYFCCFLKTEELGCQMHGVVRCVSCILSKSGLGTKHMFIHLSWEK